MQIFQTLLDKTTNLHPSTSAHASPSLLLLQVGSSTAALILEMLIFLMDAIQTNFQQASAVGSSSRAQQALNELHTQDKNVSMTDQLMVNTLPCSAWLEALGGFKFNFIRKSQWVSKGLTSHIFMTKRMMASKSVISVFILLLWM